jgi:hypothetical protein
MTYDWFKSPFTAADLKGKSVQFRVPLEQGGILQGTGVLDAAQDPRGYIRVAIINSQMIHGRMVANKVFVPVEAAANIARNPSGSKWEFTINTA